MCGIVAFWDKAGRYEASTGRIILTDARGLGCRGPDSAGIALIGPEPETGTTDLWSIRIAGGREIPHDALAARGQVIERDPAMFGAGHDTRRTSASVPDPGVSHRRPGAGAGCAKRRAGGA